MIYKSLFISILLLPIISLPAGAAPKEVTLYPQGAQVTELTKVRFQQSGKLLYNCYVTISGQADPLSFQAAPLQNDLIKIEDVAWRRLPKDEEVAVKVRRREAKQLQEEKNGLLADLEGLENQLQFWQQQTKAKAKTPAEAGVIAANLGRNTKKAFLQKLTVSQELARLDKRIKEIEEEINTAAGAGQALWEGTITFSGVAQPEAWLSYSYTLTRCGWRPAYRLDAVIPQDKIKFAWEAEVWQNSGQIWQDVDIRLAQTHAAVSPPPPLTLPSPLLKHEAAIPPKRIKSPRKKKTAAASGPTNDQETSLSPVSLGDFPLLQVVRTTLPSGLRQKIILLAENWPAALDYLARPECEPQASLQAHVHLPVSKEIPRGEALFFRNGSLLRKGEFDFSGQQKSIFVGRDPLVTVTRFLSPGTSSDKSDLTRQRRWEAQNNHSSPIKLRVEEALPLAAAGVMSNPSLSSTSAPMEEKPGLWIWTLDLQAGEKKALLHRTELETSDGQKSEMGLLPPLPSKQE